MTIIFNKISVIGLGLIGTSILHAIKVKEDKKIITYAYDINPEHRSIVSEMKIVTYVCESIKEAIKDSDLIILAIPVGAGLLCIYKVELESNLSFQGKFSKCRVLQNF